MRYAWDQFDAYFGPEQVGAAREPAAAAGDGRGWPAGTPPRQARVDRFLANSQYVAGRIRRYYNRGSAVVYPPVDTAFYRPRPSGTSAGPHSASSSCPRWCRTSGSRSRSRPAAWPGCRLTIVGRGPEEARLRQLGGRRRRVLGWRSDEEIRELYRRATAVLLPGREDFGMVPVEAQACGTPVVALEPGAPARRSSTASPACSWRTGRRRRFADGARPRVAALPFDPAAIRANAERFSRERFMTEFQAAVSTTPIAAREARHDAAVQPAARRLLRRQRRGARRWPRSCSPTSSASTS